MGFHSCGTLERKQAALMAPSLSTEETVLPRHFPSFGNCLPRDGWNDTIRRSIDWYLNGNSSAIHVGIVLAQAALESLSYRINQTKIKSEANALRQSP